MSQSMVFLETLAQISGYACQSPAFTRDAASVHIAALEQGFEAALQNCSCSPLMLTIRCESSRAECCRIAQGAPDEWSGLCCTHRLRMFCWLFDNIGERLLAMCRAAASSASLLPPTHWMLKQAIIAERSLPTCLSWRPLLAQLQGHLVLPAADKVSKRQWSFFAQRELCTRSSCASRLWQSLIVPEAPKFAMLANDTFGRPATSI